MQPEMGLFKKIAGPGGSPTYFFEIKKDDQNKQVQWYYFAGQLVGKALFDAIPIDFPICKTVYQLLL